MIDTLEKLNDVVTEVANRIVYESTQKTMSGQRYADYDMVSDLITYEDYLKYFDFIKNELYSRSEVLALDVTDDHEFDAVYGLAYCPNYQWTDGDERVFGMVEEDWERNYKTEPVEQPLSLTRKAQLLDNALVNIQKKLEMEAENKVVEVAELFGTSVSELARAGLPEAQKADEEIRIINEKLAAERQKHDFTLPIEFMVALNDYETTKVFRTFEEALAAYDAAACNLSKDFYFKTYSNEFGAVQEFDSLLYRGSPDTGEYVNSECRSHNPHVELAYAKAILSRDPVNKAAWERYNSAEEKIGVTGHKRGDDLQVGNWRVHVALPGEKYGSHDHLTNDTGKALVEFYDLRTISPEFSPNGQFTGGRYYAETLLGLDGYGHSEYPSGLSLMGDVPAWTVSAKQMEVVLDYVRENTTAREKPALEQMISSAVKRAAEGEDKAELDKENVPSTDKNSPTPGGRY